jgi:Leucine-rich repeat (LRR) protein
MNKEDLIEETRIKQKRFTKENLPMIQVLHNNIVSIQGVVQYKNLTNINLSNNQISDISHLS